MKTPNVAAKFAVGNSVWFSQRSAAVAGPDGGEPAYVLGIVERVELPNLTPDGDGRVASPEVRSDAHKMRGGAREPRGRGRAELEVCDTTGSDGCEGGNVGSTTAVETDKRKDRNMEIKNDRTLVFLRGVKRPFFEEDLMHADTDFDLPDCAQLKALNYPNVLENMRLRFLKAAKASPSQSSGTGEGIGEGSENPSTSVSVEPSIYTYAGWILFAVNPYSPCEHLYTQSVCERYFGKSIGREAPHPFAIASAAYTRLIADQKSQYIVVSGESGSGKTECSKHVLKYLIWVARRQRRLRGRASVDGRGDVANILADLLLAANPLLEFFGNAKTARNDNSSRFGKMFEIFYDRNGDHLIGANLSTYLLAKSRVVQVPNGEENYHIFHSLIAALARIAMADPENDERGEEIVRKTPRKDQIDDESHCEGEIAIQEMLRDLMEDVNVSLTPSRKSPLPKSPARKTMAETTSSIVEAIGSDDSRSPHLRFLKAIRNSEFLPKEKEAAEALGLMNAQSGAAEVPSCYSEGGDFGLQVALKAFDIFNLPRAKQRELFSILLGLILLGTVDLVDSAAPSVETSVATSGDAATSASASRSGSSFGLAGVRSAARVAQPERLALVCRLFGVPEASAELERLLTSRQIRDTRSSFTVPQAREQRASLAKGFYEAIFQKVVQLIQNRLSYEGRNFLKARKRNTLLANDANNNLDDIGKGVISKVDVHIEKRDIGEGLNTCLSGRPCVGVLDLFGFENMEPSSRNSFEQLCINYANEEMHSHFMREVVARERELALEEGIPLAASEFDSAPGAVARGAVAPGAVAPGAVHPSVGGAAPSKSAGGTLELLLGHDGVFSLLEEACQLYGAASAVNKDRSFCRRVNQFLYASNAASSAATAAATNAAANAAMTAYTNARGEGAFAGTAVGGGGFSGFVKGPIAKARGVPKVIADDTFVISHFADSVTYSAQGFVEKNQDYMSQEVRSFIQNSRLNAIFDNAATAESDEVVNAESATSVSVSNIASASASASTAASASAPIANTSGNKLLSSLFIKQMKGVINLLKRTDCFFIKCLKPNEEQVAYKFDGPRVLSQLITGGVGPVIDLMGNGFPCRIKYAKIWDKFKGMVLMTDDGFFATKKPRDFAELMMEYLGLDYSQYRLGVSQIFFKFGALSVVEKMLRDGLPQTPGVSAEECDSFITRAPFDSNLSGSGSCMPNISGPEFDLKIAEQAVRIRKFYARLQMTRSVCAIRCVLALIRGLYVHRRRKIAFEAVWHYKNVWVPKREERACRRIQKFYRDMAGRFRYNSTRRKVQRLQRFFRNCASIRKGRKWLELWELKKDLRVVHAVLVANLLMQMRELEIAAIEHEAAIMIQAFSRGFIVRKKINLIAETNRHLAAMRLQLFWRLISRAYSKAERAALRKVYAEKPSPPAMNTSSTMGADGREMPVGRGNVTSSPEAFKTCRSRMRVNPRTSIAFNETREFWETAQQNSPTEKQELARRRRSIFVDTFTAPALGHACLEKTVRDVSVRRAAGADLVSATPLRQRPPNTAQARYADNVDDDDDDNEDGSVRRRRAAGATRSLLFARPNDRRRSLQGLVTTAPDPGPSTITPPLSSEAATASVFRAQGSIARGVDGQGLSALRGGKTTLRRRNALRGDSPKRGATSEQVVEALAISRRGARGFEAVTPKRARAPGDLSEARPEQQPKPRRPTETPAAPPPSLVRVQASVQERVCGSTSSKGTVASVSAIAPVGAPLGPLAGASEGISVGKRSYDEMACRSPSRRASIALNESSRKRASSGGMISLESVAPAEQQATSHTHTHTHSHTSAIGTDQGGVIDVEDRTEVEEGEEREDACQDRCSDRGVGGDYSESPRCEDIDLREVARKSLADLKESRSFFRETATRPRSHRNCVACAAKNKEISSESAYDLSRHQRQSVRAWRMDYDELIRNPSNDSNGSSPGDEENLLSLQSANLSPAFSQNSMTSQRATSQRGTSQKGTSQKGSERGMDTAKRHDLENDAMAKNDGTGTPLFGSGGPAGSASHPRSQRTGTGTRSDTPTKSRGDTPTKLGTTHQAEALSNESMMSFGGEREGKGSLAAPATNGAAQKAVQQRSLLAPSLNRFLCLKPGAGTKAVDTPSIPPFTDSDLKSWFVGFDTRKTRIPKYPSSTIPTVLTVGERRGMLSLVSSGPDVEDVGSNDEMYDLKENSLDVTPLRILPGL